MARILSMLYAMVILLPQLSVSQPTGIHFVLRIESQFVGDTKEQVEPPPFVLRALPDRWAEWDIVTDGKAFRSRLKRRLRDLPDGAIVLQPGPNSVRFVLNSARHTYYRVQPAQPSFPNELEPTDVSVAQTGKSDVISGYPAKEVVLRYKQPLATPSGSRVVKEVEIRDWCTSSVHVSPAVSAAVHGRVTAFTPSNIARYMRSACSIALRSSWRVVSDEPEYAIVSSVMAIEPVAISKGEFVPPVGYKEVASPSRK